MPHVVISFRFDDFSADSPITLDQGILERFRECRIPLTVGVVPFIGSEEDSVRRGDAAPIPDPKARIIQSSVNEGVTDVALHGLTHTPVGSDPSGRPAEMSGLSHDRQTTRIQSGREELERITGSPPNVFIPPWNRYDATTLRVLEEQDFPVLSAGRTGTAPTGSSVDIVPFTCGLKGLRILATRERVNFTFNAPRGRTPSQSGVTAVVVLFHPYDFHEHGGERAHLDLEELRRILQRVVSHPILKTCPLKTVATRISNEDPDRYRFYARYHSSSARNLLPPDHKGGPRNPLRTFPPAEELRVALRRLWIKAILPIVCAGVLGLAVGGIISVLLEPYSQLEGSMLYLRWGALTVTVLVGAYTLWKKPVYYRGAWTLSGMVGLTVGLGW